MEINGHEETTGEEIDHACDTQSPEDRWIDKMNEERQKEFNLSEKEISDEQGEPIYHKDNVKEFIKRMKEFASNNGAMCREIDRLAGDELV